MSTAFSGKVERFVAGSYIVYGTVSTADIGDSDGKIFVASVFTSV